MVRKESVGIPEALVRKGTHSELELFRIERSSQPAPVRCYSLIGQTLQQVLRF